MYLQSWPWTRPHPHPHPPVYKAVGQSKVGIDKKSKRLEDNRKLVGSRKNFIYFESMLRNGIAWWCGSFMNFYCSLWYWGLNPEGLNSTSPFIHLVVTEDICTLYHWATTQVHILRQGLCKLLRLVIILFQPPTYLNFRYVPPCLAGSSVFIFLRNLHSVFHHDHNKVHCHP